MGMTTFSENIDFMDRLYGNSLQNCRSYKIVVLRGYIQAAREVLINIEILAPGIRYGYFSIQNCRENI